VSLVNKVRMSLADEAWCDKHCTVVELTRGLRGRIMSDEKTT